MHSLISPFFQKPRYATAIRPEHAVAKSLGSKHNEYEFLRREAAAKTRLDLTAFTVEIGHMEFYLIEVGSGNNANPEI